MKDTCALLIVKEVTKDWEILFTSLEDWMTTLCHEVGISEVFSISEKEWAEKDYSSLVKDALHLLVLESDRPYLTVEEILAAFQIHKSTEKSTTFFLAGDSDTLAKPSGWYRNDSQGSSATGHAPVRNTSRITSRSQLAEANKYFQQNIIQRHLEAGVHIPIADGVMIGPKVTLEMDAEILPGSILKGKTSVASGSTIGPNTQLTDATIGKKCNILSSYVLGSVLKDYVSIGPMANIREGCTLEDGVRVGDFVELKKAHIGSNTAVAHLTYLGDCTVGSDCNFGSGSTIVNYDGSSKYQTIIGNHVFVGCNCSLVAPVTVGDDAYLAAGSVITEDVPAGALGIARSRQTTKPDWSTKRGLFRKK